MSLPIDGSRDQAEGSKKLLSYIAKAPSLDQIPQKFRCHVTHTECFFYAGKVEVDVDGIRRRNATAAEKYKNRVFKCKLCGWAYSNKYAKKAKEHGEECPAVWIFEDWKPQTLEALKFMKS